MLSALACIRQLTSVKRTLLVTSSPLSVISRQAHAAKVRYYFDDKTELMAIGIRSKLSQVTPNIAPMSISGCDIPFSQSVRNLGFYLEETLSMDAHIKYLCRILFCQLRRTGKKNRSFLSTGAAKKLAVSLILSRFLLAGIPDNKLNKLQRIQNHAARLVYRKSRHASATALLSTLHWLPVKARIQYKIACLFSVYLSEQYGTLYF